MARRANKAKRIVDSPKSGPSVASPDQPHVAGCSTLESCKSEALASSEAVPPPSPATFPTDSLALAPLIAFFQLLDRWDQEANTKHNSQEGHK
jgi:hypothetical protein